MNINELSDFMAIVPTHHTVMLTANHGVGKSKVVATVIRDVLAKRHGVKPEDVDVIDKRASQLDPGDLTGGIFLVGGQTFNAPPYWLPVHQSSAAWLEDRLKAAGREWVPFKDNTKVSVLFLDEVNRARPETLQCIFELILDRSLHGIKIPDTCYVMAAVNGDRDTYDVQEQDPAFTDRVVMIPFEPTFDELYTHLDIAVGMELIHEVIPMYLRSRQDKIDPSPKLIKEARDRGDKLFSRRSWYRFGECLSNYAKADNDIVANLASGKGTLKDLIAVGAGYIGTGDASAFAKYVADEFSVLTPKDILNNYTDAISTRVKKMAKTNASGLAGLQRNLVEELKKLSDKLPEKIQKNLVRFAEDIPREVRSGFWMAWHGEKRAQADGWYTSPHRRLLIVETMMPPEAYNKWVTAQQEKGVDLSSDKPDNK
jgi:MoxR-like ATPase